jgi:hypothetical protein
MRDYYDGISSCYDMAMACSKNLRTRGKPQRLCCITVALRGGADIIFQRQGLLPLSGTSTLSEQINPAR